MGVKFLRAYPITQALALPLGKDKQPKICPRQVIYTNPLRPDNPRHIYTKTNSTRGELHLIYIYKERGRGEYEIHPRERLVASPLFQVSKLRSLNKQTGNVLKTSFWDWPYNWPEVSSIDVKYYAPPTLGRTFRCKFTYIFLITKYFLGKNHILTKKSWFIDKNSD